MAMNFKIIQLKSKNNIRLTLDGDFDGSSAHELINTLKSCSREAGMVVIDTSGLKSVHPFGQSVLYRNLSGLGGRRSNLIFSGDHRRQLSRPWDF
jgi:anti-anti-sigma regulatory factor